MSDNVRPAAPGTQADTSKFEERLTQSFERVATTTERVGIPAATFAIGSTALIVSALPYGKEVWVLPWLGATLILAALVTYIWLTARSTIRVQLPPPPIPVELQEQLQWMRDQIEKLNASIIDLTRQ
jgi:hypothetical protein